MNRRGHWLLYMKVFTNPCSPINPMIHMFSVMDARKQNSVSSEEEQADIALNDASLIKVKGDKKKQMSRKKGDGSERKRPSRAEIQRREQEKTSQTASYFATLDEIHDDMTYGDQDAVHTWITIAGTLVDDLREAKELFPADRVSNVLRGKRHTNFQFAVYTKIIHEPF